MNEIGHASAVAGMVLLLVGPMQAQPLKELRQFGYVIVTPNGPDDGGDFGSNTPNTKTAGIQEALNHAKSLNTKQHRSVNVFVAGGHYRTHETIKIPWMGERFRFQAEESWIDYQPTTGDAVTIDSQMNGRFHFGYVSGLNLEDGWIIRVKPNDPGPSAPLPKERQCPVIVSTLFEINAIVAKEYFKDGVEHDRGNGLLLDGSAGPILWSKVDISELNTCSTGVELKGQCHCNSIDVWFNHGCNTHIQIDEGAMQNKVETSINSEKVPGSIGARIFGCKNSLFLTFSQTSPGNSVVFEAPARDNVVYVSDMAFGFTNNARVPNNRIIPNTPQGFSIETQAMPQSGKELVNRYPGTVQITVLSAGAVSQWSLIDSLGTAQTVDSGLTPGQQIVLEPGDSIRLDYSESPVWKWRAIR